jgi:gas vesicle protein
MSLSVEQAYDEIEKILLYGFLTVGVSYGDEHFLFKSITDKEYLNLDLYRSSDKTASDLLYHLSFCTVFINDRNFLEDRFNSIHDLIRVYLGMPVPFIMKVRDTIQKLNSEYLYAIKFLEGFCYTDRSRYLWRVFDVNNRSKYLGIPGLDSVGMNSVQENWIVINKRLDEEEVYSRDLNFALLVASSMNPKGSKTLSRNYDAHKREIDELRDDIAKYGYDRKRVEEQQKKAEWSAPVKSREDLVRELYRQMSGHKDKHDLFIDEWMKEQQAVAERAKAQAEARQQEFRAKIKDVDLGTMEPSRPISTAELNRRLAAKKLVSKDKFTGQPMVLEDAGEMKERYLKKMGSTIISKR